MILCPYRGKRGAACGKGKAAEANGKRSTPFYNRAPSAFIAHAPNRKPPEEGKEKKRKKKVQLKLKERGSITHRGGEEKKPGHRPGKGGLDFKKP